MAQLGLSKTRLDYYHCTFFMPLFGLEDFSPLDSLIYSYCPNDEKLPEAERQAYHYFSPILREILFECSKTNKREIEPVREWRLPASQIQHWELHLDPQKKADSPAYNEVIKAVFKEVRLFRYFNDIYLLSFRVAAKDIENQPLLDTWLHFTRLARVLYPSFIEQEKENKIAPLRIYDANSNRNLCTALDTNRLDIPNYQGELISSVVRYLLLQFFGLDNKNKLNQALNKNSQIYDDRLFVSVAYSIAGEKLQPDELKRILYLAMWVDRFYDTADELDDYVYSKNSLENMSEGKIFDLWEGRGGLFAFTDYSNVYVYREWFFNNVIAPNHIPYEYDRMLVQALFYQASLRLYDERISKQTGEILKDKRLEDIKEQRHEFIQFTNRYWFHNLTEQMQGKAIFNLQKQGLGLQEHYDIIKDELERTDEYLQTSHEIRLANLADRFTRYGLVLAVLALYFTILPVLDDSVTSQTSKSLWNLVHEKMAGWGFPLSNEYFLLFVIVPIVLLLLTKPFIKLLRFLKKCFITVF